MITDTLAHLSRYRGLHKNLDTAIDWLAAHDVTALPNGRTVIDGDAVFGNVMDAELRDAEDAAFEYHRRYADLQIDLTGAERWDWAAQGSPLVANAPYDAASDAGFVAGPEQASRKLGEGRFVLLFPEEPPKPSCQGAVFTCPLQAVATIEMG